MPRSAQSATFQELSGWGRRPRSGAWVLRPREAGQVVVPPRPQGMIARGLGRSYGDAALNAGGLVLDMTALAGISRFDVAAGVITVAAGTSLHHVIRAVVPFGWFPAVTPGTRYVTVGGAIACDVHGKNHHADGGFCRHVRSFRLQTPAGDAVTVTKEDTPEFFWATAGGMGLTGTITEATLKLVPVETAKMRVETERVNDLDELMAAMEGDDRHYQYSVAWVDLLARGISTGRGVLTRANHARLEELPERGRRDPLAYASSDRVTVPDVVPDGLVNRLTARAFNELWFRKAPRRKRSLQSLSSYFHPLDVIDGWNRLYGRRGFLQYQFVIPAGAEDVIRTVVGRLASRRCPSVLAVLKRFGPEEGYLSFPLAGWTLALDIPIGDPGLGALLDAFDGLVLSGGGRVYLAKDARLQPEAFRAMYPRHGEWCGIRDKLDPAGMLRSDLARRLELIDAGRGGTRS